MYRKFLDLFSKNNPITTLSYENQIISSISVLVCLFASITNFVYFTYINKINNSFMIINSLLFVLFAIVYYLIHNISRNDKTQEILLTSTTILILVFIVVRYYPLIGPTVWTYSMIVILSALSRKNVNTLVLYAITFFFLGIYITFEDIPFLLTKNYSISQFFAFSLLFIISTISFVINKKKTEFIESQFLNASKISHLLEEQNKQLNKEISEKEAAKKSLFNSERRYKAIVKSLPDVVFVINNEGFFIDCEIGDNNWLLYKKEDFIGKTLTDTMPPYIAKESTLKVNETLTSGISQLYEYFLDLPTGISYYEVRFTKLNDTEVLAILRDVTTIQRQKLDIEYISYHDFLTGLYNRRFFDEEFNRLDTARNLPLSIVLLDTNSLKLVNDAFGHFYGDELLKKVALILQDECRDDDIIARIGGDEFILLLPKTDSTDTLKILERIKARLSSTLIHSIPLSASIGFHSKTDTQEKLNDVFKKAEANMYEQKLLEGPNARRQIIEMIIQQLADSDYEISSHRTKVLALKLGQSLILNKQDIDDLETLANVCDIGYIALKKILLDKHYKYSPEDIIQMRRHSESGYHILRLSEDYSSIADDVLHIHENFDGSGYPKKLKGEEIPLLSRILFVCLAYVSMTSNRIYKPQLSHEEAIIELKQNSGTQFDPNIVNHFIDIATTSL